MAKDYFYLNVGEWLYGARLRRCSHTTRGLWISALCAIHRSGRGQLSGTLEQLDRVFACGGDIDTVRRAIDELKRYRVAHVIEAGGVITIKKRADFYTPYSKRNPARWFSGELVSDFPPVAACYVFIIDGACVYVGSSVDLSVRMRQHRNGPKWAGRGVTVKYRPSMKYGDWLMRELRLIRRLQPAHNRLGVDNA